MRSSPAWIVIQPTGGRRGLIVLSDGEDRYSEASADQDVLARARRADVMVYPVALGKRLPPLVPRARRRSPAAGRSTSTIRGRLDQTLADIARELRFQYLLGYAPPERASGAADPRAGGREDGRWHAIHVQVKRSDVQVRARDGYYGR